jgi:hypothetical protein
MKECKCSLRTKLVGDGCEVCNPELALDVAKDRIEELETELAETRRQLSEGPVCGGCEHKRARRFLENQIADGELIPLDVVHEWGCTVTVDCPDGADEYALCRQSLQQFAKEMAGK